MREKESFNTEFAQATEYPEKTKEDRESVVIELLAGGKPNGKPVALRRERAGRVGSVGTRGIFKAIDIEHELAVFTEAVENEVRKKDHAHPCGRSFGGEFRGTAGRSLSNRNIPSWHRYFRLHGG